jgi:GNAT superfamily N-acetyltransferase
MAIHIDWYAGPRSALRALFELAEDSQVQLDSYIELGRVLLARDGPEIVGHLQLVPTSNDRDIELKSMAVIPERRGGGVGRSLIEAAIERCRSEGAERIHVSTAAASTGNLRFYQRMGFRMLSIDRDAFTPVTGYPEPILIDGIPLLDRVWLSLELGDQLPPTV